VGYVAFYAGDYSAALKALQDASQTDPFVQCLMAECYEKLGDTANARAFYQQAAGSTAHSVPAAFARPFAQRKLHL
jgi:Tfp pilus assembly protein PilF